MQVDEVAVIRLSPIVYNKELMKRVTGSDDPPVPASPKQSMSKSIDTELRKEGGERASLCKGAACTRRALCSWWGRGAPQPQVMELIARNNSLLFTSVIS